MKNSEQPAFSSAYAPSNDWNSHYEPGLTKREYFAAKAMQGYLASGASAIDAAKWSIIASDALLAELESNANNCPYNEEFLAIINRPRNTVGLDASQIKDIDTILKTTAIA